MPEKITEFRIEEIKKYWTRQQIVNTPAPEQNLQAAALRFRLPDDFFTFYSKINGMKGDETDEECFLFYPVEGIMNPETEFSGSATTLPDNLFLFAEYMHKSWWCGVQVVDNENYIIGIIPHASHFKPITNSLNLFLFLYLRDSEVLYDYL